MNLTPEEREMELERARIQAKANYDEVRSRGMGNVKKILIGFAIFMILIIGMCSMG